MVEFFASSYLYYYFADNDSIAPVLYFSIVFCHFLYTIACRVVSFWSVRTVSLVGRRIRLGSWSQEVVGQGICHFSSMMFLWIAISSYCRIFGFTAEGIIYIAVYHFCL